MSPHMVRMLFRSFLPGGARGDARTVNALRRRGLVDVTDDGAVIGTAKGAAELRAEPAYRAWYESPAPAKAFTGDEHLRGSA